jgi:uncharacterized YccA/Bax inhibitor family protein
MRTSNPALGAKTFLGLAPARNAAPMTVRGTVDRSFFLLLLVAASATWTWDMAVNGEYGTLTGLMWTGVIGGLVAAVVTIFKKEWAPFTAPLYALLEGLVLGALSAILEASYSGIVMQAVGLTFGVFLTMLVLYRTGVIKATEKFKLGVVAATLGVGVAYLISFVLGFFGVPMVLFGGGTIGIVFGVIVVGIAALNLILDFDFIEEGAAAGAPKYMEWYGAFGLMVTLIWLYLEILRLLARLRER